MPDYELTIPLQGGVGVQNIGQRTTGGTTPFKALSLAETPTEIKDGEGDVFWMHVMNMSETVVYLKFFDSPAAGVVLGTTIPVLTFAVPTLGDTNGSGFVLAIPNGIQFDNGITVVATTGVADDDTTPPTEGDILINLGYA